MTIRVQGSHASVHTHIYDLHHKISARKEDELKIGVDCRIVQKVFKNVVNCGSSKFLATSYVGFEGDSFNAVFLNYVSVTSLA